MRPAAAATVYIYNRQWRATKYIHSTKGFTFSIWCMLHFPTHTPMLGTFEARLFYGYALQLYLVSPLILVVKDFLSQSFFLDVDCCIGACWYSSHVLFWQSVFREA